MPKKKMIFIYIIMTWFIAFLSGCSSNNDVPTAKNGQINLSKWNFNQQGNVRLDGQWEFYWKKLIAPKQFQSLEDKPYYMNVPKKWNDEKLGSEVLTGKGFGTYRLRLTFNKSELHTQKALYIMNVYTSYRLWMNGKLMDEKGKVGRDQDSSNLDFAYDVIEFTPDKPITEMVIQVANFDHYKGGITTNILLGNEQSIDQYFYIRQGIEGFIIGGLVLMGFYHLALYTMRREDLSPLYFGLFCLVFAIYSSFGSPYEFVYSSFIDWSILLKIEYMTIYVISPIFMLYVKSVYPKETSKLAIWVTFLLCFAYIGITLFTSISIFTRFMPFYNVILMAMMCYLLYVFIMALIRKRIGAKLILTMFFIFVLTSVHDIFYYYGEIIFNMKIAPLGFLFFMGAHSYVLSLRFARAFRDVEDLTNEIETTQREIIYTLGEIAEVRSRETGNHVKRVAEYSRLLAVKYGLSEKEIELIKSASPMHDVGKVGIPDSILNKPGKLTIEEFEVMKSHAIVGYEMLKHSTRDVLQCAAEIALTHHEKWDGTGYPYGLKGERIPIMGRITAVADVFDALGSDRVYKKAWHIEDILDYYQQERGKHFDPKIVDIFLENFHQFLEIRERYSDYRD